jgi:hypothetical protein
LLQDVCGSGNQRSPNCIEICTLPIEEADIIGFLIPARSILTRDSASVVGMFLSTTFSRNLHSRPPTQKFTDVAFTYSSAVEATTSSYTSHLLRGKPGADELSSSFLIIVYVAFLALSVFYHHLRYSRRASSQEDAREDFNAACTILTRLRVCWPVAYVMGTIAQRISDELDKIPSLESLRTDPSLTLQKESATDAESVPVDIVSDSVAMDFS